MAGTNTNSFTEVAFQKSLEKPVKQKKSRQNCQDFPKFRDRINYFLATNLTANSKLSSIALSPMLSKKDLEP